MNQNDFLRVKIMTTVKPDNTYQEITSSWPLSPLVPDHMHFPVYLKHSQFTHRTVHYTDRATMKLTFHKRGKHIIIYNNIHNI